MEGVSPFLERGFSLVYGIHLIVIAVIFGEDVAFGGVFRCTVGLRDKHGKVVISKVYYNITSCSNC